MEARQIYINDNSRLQVGEVELTSGDALEVLIVDGDSPKWIKTTVEHNGKSYYLTGLKGVSAVGLFARVN